MSITHDKMLITFDKLNSSTLYLLPPRDVARKLPESTWNYQNPMDFQK